MTQSPLRERICDGRYACDSVESLLIDPAQAQRTTSKLDERLQCG